MKLPLSAQACGLASAAVTGIIYILCVFLFAVAPEAAFSLGRQLFHGVEMSSQTVLTWGNALFGLIFWLILSYVIGWLFAVIYNKLLIGEDTKA